MFRTNSIAIKIFYILYYTLYSGTEYNLEEFLAHHVLIYSCNYLHIPNHCVKFRSVFTITEYVVLFVIICLALASESRVSKVLGMYIRAIPYLDNQSR